jgi:hypothetical protein
LVLKDGIQRPFDRLVGMSASRRQAHVKGIEGVLESSHRLVTLVATIFIH